MSPRPYTKRARQEAVDGTRLRIVAAAREVLSDPAGVTSFTIDAIAARADVARMTVYYQFKSKRGLLEAIFNDLGQRGGMHRLREVFQNPDPSEALDAFVERFVRFYASDRVIIRRLNALAALDPEVDSALSERGSWRRMGLTELTKRCTRKRSDSLVDVLFTLTSFETFDSLARGKRSLREVAKLIQQLVRAAVSE